MMSMILISVNSFIFITINFSVSEWKHQLCNGNGITKNSTISKCDCKPGYNGTLCQWCQMDRFIWRGTNGTVDYGNGVECGKFILHTFRI